MKKRKIVVVDDNTDFLNELSETLSLSGYETFAYDNGKDALRRIKREKPDLVLLDMKMDGMNGYDVAKAINKEPAINKTPIIAMTGYYTTEEHQRLMEISGIKACIIKPFNPLDILVEIEKH